MQGTHDFKSDQSSRLFPFCFSYFPRLFSRSLRRRDLKRTRLEHPVRVVPPLVVVQNSRPCFSQRQHPRNWRLRGLRQADKTTKNGKTCSSSCVEDETAIITCSNAHRSLERAQDTRLRSGISDTRTKDTSGILMRPEACTGFVLFPRSLFAPFALRGWSNRTGHWPRWIKKVISCSFPRILDEEG